MAGQRISPLPPPSQGRGGTWGGRPTCRSPGAIQLCCFLPWPLAHWRLCALCSPSSLGLGTRSLSFHTRMGVPQSSAQEGGHAPECRNRTELGRGLWGDLRVLERAESGTGLRVCLCAWDGAGQAGRDRGCLLPLSPVWGSGRRWEDAGAVRAWQPWSSFLCLVTADLDTCVCCAPAPF